MSEKTYPVESLAKALRSYFPPSIDGLISIIADNKHYADFKHLIDKFLPERKKLILAEATVEGQLSEFASHFEDRYFPLPYTFRDGEADAYSDLTESLPLIARGFGYTEYDNLIQSGYANYRLMTYFFRQPWDENGARVALAGACLEHVTKDILERIPEGGYTPEEMHKLLDGTEYEALAKWGDAISMCTGNELLDMDDEMLGSSILPEWNRENVEYYTQQWQEADVYENKVGDLAEKFDSNPQEFMVMLLDYIDRRK